jgi:hypothetical protein
VDGTSLVTEVDGLNVRPELKKHVHELAGSLSSDYARQWKVQQDKVYSTAFTSYLKAPRPGTEAFAAIPVAHKVWLQENDPDAYERLKRRSEQDEAAKKKGRSGAADPARQSAFIRALMDVRTHPEKYGPDEYDEPRLNSEWGAQLTPSDLRQLAEKIGGEKARLKGDLRKDLPGDVDRHMLAAGAKNGLWKSETPKDLKWSEKQIQRYYEVRKRLKEAADAVTVGGKLPDDEWYGNWIKDNIDTKIEVPGKVFGNVWPNKVPAIRAQMDQEAAARGAPAARAAPAAKVGGWTIGRKHTVGGVTKTWDGKAWR